ncbi:gamma-glutamylcyclotransferase family protein [Streptomyces sp. B1866]|uniref:gamma-glutamylcyclotransferase family protein n=1 Tax=Streptomyces sp. B1866 TaxID=3075431 RepID=UPI002890C636|nr:gamma-glutamylcyclotransferase family protein [Streptomyces sp. B1866]MDT3395244.1 gamma-glutamylcyclotransferase family protein [Streptomyces sp. B1866]
MPELTPREASSPLASGRRNRLAAGPDVLFVYGTLQFDAVLEALLGRIPSRTPASAPGWRAAALEGRLYPGLVPAPTASAPGLLLTDLSKAEWAILDAFEDARYNLGQVTLSSGDRGWAYLWPDGEVRPEDWDAEHFAALHLEAYAARCARIAERLVAEGLDAVG